MPKETATKPELLEFTHKLTITIKAKDADTADRLIQLKIDKLKRSLAIKEIVRNS